MADILIQNQELIYDDDGQGYPDSWYGYYIDQSESNALTFRNNYMSSNNVNGYMLEAGDEGVGSGNNRLDNALIEHNYFKWNGTPTNSIITHGIFTGYQAGVKIRYNYCDGVPMAIIRKSDGGSDSAGGIVAYNIMKNPKPGVVCKGMKNVKIINNTFYSSLNSTTENGYNRAFIEIYYNDSIGTSATATGCKVYNNIFYAVDSGIRFISVDSYSSEGFECDYNVYWCENSANNEPRFTYHGSSYTWTQWRALGYDAHSVIINPNFHSITNFYESSSRAYFAFIPERRLNYGINLGLGELVSHGLDYENKFNDLNLSGTPKTQIQDSNWQVGAYVLRTGNNIGGDWYLAPWGSDTLGDGSFNNPWFTLEKLWDYVSAGDIAYMRGGEYNYLKTQWLTGASGTSGNYISLLNYRDEVPIIQPGTGWVYDGWYYGILFQSINYIHVRGLEVRNFKYQQTSPCRGIMAQHVNNSIFERLSVHGNELGMMLTGNSGGNLILNSDFYENYDPYSPLPYGNGDGLDVSSIPNSYSNTVRGCRAWKNSDDGFDFWASEGIVYVENCWAWSNGYREDGTTTGGDGNGFKLGQVTETTATTRRYLYNCIGALNRVNNFSHNVVDPQVLTCELYNCFSYGAVSYAGYQFNWGAQAATNSILRNNISFNDIASYYGDTWITEDHNSWDTGYSVSAADFLSTDPTQLLLPRQYDGSLPIINFGHLAVGSDLIDTGVNVNRTTDGDGKAWHTVPSLGAFEYQEALTGYYVATFGNDTTGSGTFANPYKTLYKAWTTHTAAGVTIYLRGGVYPLDAYTNLGTYSGTSGNTRKVYNYPNEKPTFTPSQTWLDSTTQDTALYLRADYVHVKGFEISGFVQRRYASYSHWQGTSSFVLYDSDHCIIERLNCHHGGFGITVNGNTKGTDNLILNCDTHHNYDPYTLGYEYGGVDGITIRVDLTAGTVNTIRGCRMWDNSDDGFDGWGNEGMLIWEDCWAFHNGYREDEVSVGGDGNGIKFGPIRTLWEEDQSEYNQHLRTLQRCIAYNNRAWGFHENATVCIRWLYNNIAYKNIGGGFAFNGSYINDPVDIVRNNIAYLNGGSGSSGEGYFNTSSVVDHNTFLYNSSYNSNYSVSDADFVSLDDTQLYGERQADGSLPEITFLHLVEGSDLIDSGTDVGLEYLGSAPDLGPFEFVPTDEGGIYGIILGTATVSGIIKGKGLIYGAIASQSSAWAYLSSRGVFMGYSQGTSYVVGILKDHQDFVAGVMRYTDFWSPLDLKTFCTFPAQEHITVGSNYISCRNLSISKIRNTFPGSQSELHELSNVDGSFVAGGEYGKVNVWARYKPGEISYNVALPTNCYDNPTFTYTAPGNTLKGCSNFAGYYHHEDTRPTYWGAPHQADYTVYGTTEIRGGLQRGRLCPILSGDPEDETYWARVKVQAWLRVNLGSYSLVGTSGFVDLSIPSGVGATLIYTMGSHGETTGNDYTVCLRPVYMDTDEVTPLAVCEGGVEILTYHMGS
jgi:hypothetical protein